MQPYRHYIKLAGMTLCIFISACQKKKDIDPISTSDLQHRLAIAAKDTNFISLDTAILLARTVHQQRDFYSSGKRTSSLGSTASLAPIPAYTVYDRQHLPAAYALNYTGGGFTIISADKRLPTIMAFSEQGHLDTLAVPLGFDRWLTTVRDSVNNRRYTASSAEGVNASIVSTLSVSPGDPGLGTLTDQVDALVPARWGQSNGYNEFCPAGSCSSTGNGKTLAGCVAIAIGQVMFKHRYPAAYDWSAMQGYGPTLEAARMIKEIGDRVGMHWGCDASGADGDNTFGCLQSYNYSVKKFDPDDSGSGPLPAMQNLHEGKPMIMTGGTKGKTWLVFNTYVDGHEWVCDGFKQYKKMVRVPVGNPRDGFHVEWQPRLFSYYHMNWGWFGAYEGYYLLGNLTPTDPVISDQNYTHQDMSFNYKMKVFYDIAPKN